MKRILIELDDQSARDLERVAPAKKRMRAEFIRLAIRRALDLELDRATEEAYRARPLEGAKAAADLSGWDEHNALSKKASGARRARPKTRAA